MSIRIEKPRYEQIYDILRREIASGFYKPGDKVPSEHQLAEQYGVSRITTKKALELLRADKLVVSRRGKGSFVSDTNPSIALTDTAVQLMEQDPVPARTKPLLIGYITPDFGSAYGLDIVYAAEREAERHASFLAVRRTFADGSSEEQAIRDFLSAGADGLIIFPVQSTNISEELLKLMVNRFPFVMIDRYIKGVSCASVSTDNKGAARTGIHHLFDLGHKNIGLLTLPPNDLTSVEDRIEGFVQAHAERGVAVKQHLWVTDITSTIVNTLNRERELEKDRRSIERMLLDHPEMTAMMAMEYNIALIAMEAAEQLGRKVPEELSILCFDSPDIPMSYPFTHIRQNQEAIGRQAVREIIKQIKGEREPSKFFIEAELVIGKSTGNRLERGDAPVQP